MKISSIRKFKKLDQQTVFLRVDFNVPLAAGKIKEDYKIRAGLASLEFLLARGARLLVATHLGEPSGRQPALSTKPLAARLKTLLKRPVKFSPEAIGPKVLAAAKKIKPGEVLMLENLRFYPGEYANDAVFAKALAAPADIYVNDAFAVCHRAQASVSAIKKYLPSYAGLLLEQEIGALNKVLKPRKPLVVIMGGAKVATKAPLISKLYPAASQILIGGALANNFFSFQKWETGKSLVDKGSAASIAKFYKGKKLVPKIILPPDVVVKTAGGEARVKAPAAVKSTEKILDIGPKTISLYADYIKKAQTLVWNGPFGKFEENSFKHGTLAIARLIASRSSGRAYGVVGGGETVEALKLTKMAEYVDWISTAGGAMLSYLGGDKLPGLKGIIKN
ncbi:MAG: phosphoglycerate kinase [Patescibacteria group bacterium]